MPLIDTRTFEIPHFGNTRTIDDIWPLAKGEGGSYFASNMPGLISLESQVKSVSDTAALLYAEAVTGNFAQLNAVVTTNIGEYYGVVEARVNAFADFLGSPVLSEVLRLGTLVYDVLEEFLEELWSLVAVSFDIVTDAVSMIPYLGWVVKIAKSIVRVILAIRRMKEKKAWRPDPVCLGFVKFDKDADEATASKICGTHVSPPGPASRLDRQYVDWTSLFSAPSRDGISTFLALDTNRAYDGADRIPTGYILEPLTDNFATGFIPGALGYMRGWQVPATAQTSETHNIKEFPFHATEISDTLPSSESLSSQLWAATTQNSLEAFRIRADEISESWHRLLSGQGGVYLDPKIPLRPGDSDGHEFWRKNLLQPPESPVYQEIYGQGKDPLDPRCFSQWNKSDFGKDDANKYEHIRSQSAATALDYQLFPILMSYGKTGWPSEYKISAFRTGSDLHNAAFSPLYAMGGVEPPAGSLCHGEAAVQFNNWLLNQFQTAHEDELTGTILSGGYDHPGASFFGAEKWKRISRHSLLSTVVPGQQDRWGSCGLGSWTPSGAPRGSGCDMPSYYNGQIDFESPGWNGRPTGFSYVSIYWWIKYICEIAERNQQRFLNTEQAAYISSDFGYFLTRKGSVNSQKWSAVVEQRKEILQTAQAVSQVELSLVIDPTFRSAVAAKKAQTLSLGGGHVPGVAAPNSDTGAETPPDPPSVGPISPSPQPGSGKSSSSAAPLLMLGGLAAAAFLLKGK